MLKKIQWKLLTLLQATNEDQKGMLGQCSQILGEDVKESNALAYLDGKADDYERRAIELREFIANYRAR